MKARDIIPGWPRGRSTTAPLFCRESIPSFQGWPLADITAFGDEFFADLRYHQSQERMMHEYRTKTGQFELRKPIFKLKGWRGQ